MRVYLETSSYLPLIWTTPYTTSVVELLRQRHAQGCTFLLQEDCIREASGYLSFIDDWRYNPAVRIRNLVHNLGKQEVEQLPFPSTAVQLLLGGNIWPQAQYLNFVRHTAFFFIDIVDSFTFEKPADDLLHLADKVDERVASFRTMFSQHMKATTLELPTKAILPYWGKWYLPVTPEPFHINIFLDPRPYNLASDKLRDIYHYDCALHDEQRPDEMLVANTGFKRNVKTHFGTFEVPLVCAETATTRFFGAEVN